MAFTCAPRTRAGPRAPAPASVSRREPHPANRMPAPPPFSEFATGSKFD